MRVRYCCDDDECEDQNESYVRLEGLLFVAGRRASGCGWAGNIGRGCDVGITGDGVFFGGSSSTGVVTSGGGDAGSVGLLL